MGLLGTIWFGARAVALRRTASKSPEKILATQQRRLRRLLRHASEHSSFYADKYRGIDLECAPLTDLPTTSKAELMGNFDRLNADPRLRKKDLQDFLDDPASIGKLFLGEYIVSHTSGSQGQPMILVQRPKQLELLFALQGARGNAAQLDFLTAARHLAKRVRLAVVTLKRGLYPSACAFEYMPASARSYIDLLRLSGSDDDVVERLNDFRPTHLTAYASVLSDLAQSVEAGQLRLRPELTQVINNSEMLNHHARLRYQEIFGVPVLDNYATGECPFLSNGCPAGPGMHVNADWAILEVVDEDNQPVPDGVAGAKIFITNLSNFVQPIIRYEVGDIVTMATEPCRCGSNMPRIERIDGRATDNFRIRLGSKDNTLSAIIFQHAFEHLIHVREWQVTQTDRNRFTVAVELLPDAEFQEERVRSALDNQLDRYGLRNALEVDIEVSPKLQPDPKTHKVRRVIPLSEDANRKGKRPEPVVA